MKKDISKLLAYLFLRLYSVYTIGIPRGERPMGNLRPPSALPFFADTTGILVSYFSSYASILAIILLLPDLHFSSFPLVKPNKEDVNINAGEVTPGPPGVYKFPFSQSQFQFIGE